MDRWSQNKTEVAKAVWERLLGCFGDGLLRKFGAAPPEEWIAGLGMLTAAQHERGLRRLVFGWKGGPPNLPDFMRLCRSVGSDEFDEGPEAVPALPNPDAFHGDKWDIAANQLLLMYVRTQIPADPRRYGAPNSRELAEATRVMVSYKNKWAAFMRDWGVDSQTGEILTPTGPERTQSWHRCMESAESEIAQLRAVA